jgi:hypothetical protein
MATDQVTLSELLEKWLDCHEALNERVFIGTRGVLPMMIYETHHHVIRCSTCNNYIILVSNEDAEVAMDTDDGIRTITASDPNLFGKLEHAIFVHVSAHDE